MYSAVPGHLKPRIETYGCGAGDAMMMMMGIEVCVCVCIKRDSMIDLCGSGMSAKLLAWGVTVWID